MRVSLLYLYARSMANPPPPRRASPPLPPPPPALSVGGGGGWVAYATDIVHPAASFQALGVCTVRPGEGGGGVLSRHATTVWHGG